MDWLTSELIRVTLYKGLGPCFRRVLYAARRNLEGVVSAISQFSDHYIGFDKRRQELYDSLVYELAAGIPSSTLTSRGN